MTPEAISVPAAVPLLPGLVSGCSVVACKTSELIKRVKFPMCHSNRRTRHPDQGRPAEGSITFPKFGTIAAIVGGEVQCAIDIFKVEGLGRRSAGPDILYQGGASGGSGFQSSVPGYWCSGKNSVPAALTRLLG